MQKPTDIATVHCLVGMVNYLAMFLSHLSDICEPLKQLSKKDMQWQLTQVHDLAVNKMNEVITTTPVLRYFDPKQLTTIQCDASQTGLGAALLEGDNLYLMQAEL